MGPASLGHSGGWIHARTSCFHAAQEGIVAHLPKQTLKAGSPADRLPEDQQQHTPRAEAGCGRPEVGPTNLRSVALIDEPAPAARVLWCAGTGSARMQTVGRARALATVAISGGPVPSSASVVLCVLAELLKAWLHHLFWKASVSLAAGFLTVASVGKKLLVLDQGISSSNYWEKNEMVGNQSSSILPYIAVLRPWRSQESGK